MMNPEQDNLVAKVNSKNEKAWKTFFNSYYGALCNHGFRILQDEAVAEDVVQEVFVKIWDSDLKFGNEKALSVYLYRAVTNNSLKYLRDKNIEDERLRLWSEVAGEMSEDDFSSVVREEVLRKLRELIDRLPGERRQVIMMSMEGMSGEEIAEKLGVTIHTVKQQKYRAYNFIREQLGRQWVVFALFFM